MKKILLLIAILAICAPCTMAKSDHVNQLMKDLEHAIFQADVAEVHRILELGVSVEPIASRGHLVYDPLGMAVFEVDDIKSLDIIRDLVAHGANVTAAPHSRWGGMVIKEGSTLYNLVASFGGLIDKNYITHVFIYKTKKLNPDSLLVQKLNLLLDLASKMGVLDKEKELLQGALKSGYYTDEVVCLLLSYNVEVRDRDIREARKYAKEYPNAYHFGKIVELLETKRNSQREEFRKFLKEELKRAFLSYPQDPTLWKY